MLKEKRINLLERERRPKTETVAQNNGQSVKDAVEVRVEEMVIPTHMPAPPDKNPMFLERRVYQGSSGKVYPLPVTDRICERRVDRKWKAVWIENQYLRVLILPEIGGRIHVLQDKTNGYDAIYRQPVIKPALVGLAGPWISGGIEFNWPQHHRPATFLPADFEIERGPDGSKTIWCGDHDPMCRMKGMHGVCLHPGKSFLELKVRAYNRTPLVQTFLWWANVATRVHEAYQSFFPPDVHCVADHARRSMSEFPLARGVYYGIHYGRRGARGVPANEIPSQFVPPHCRPARSPVPGLPDYAPNDLSFYANIPVPTSYMCLGSREDFFGGYDYKARAGIVHIANHHISPGKKQWTWGNHEFGYAWDRNLTDADAAGEYGPYIEIMAGVYTDNQPDFSFLQPGETKSWSQYWYPIQKIGPAQQANLDAAVSLRLEKGKISAGIAVTEAHAGALLTLSAKGKTLARWTRDLSPALPFTETVALPDGVAETDCALSVRAADGRQLIAYQPGPVTRTNAPPPATEPLAPEEIAHNDELFITGLHLDQYRHATRMPTLYWLEALRRDPLDSRCNNAMGLWHLRRGEFATAETYFRKAIERLTRRNANPYDGEAYYNLGLCLRYLERPDEAYDSLYKATWNQAWAAAAFHALAEIDCLRRRWNSARDHVERSLQLDTNNLRARNLKTIILKKLDLAEEADEWLRHTVKMDPLDGWARHLQGRNDCGDLQVRLDLAHDYARAGFLEEAIAVLKDGAAAAIDLPDQNWGAAPLVAYTLGWLLERAGDQRSARKQYRQAAALRPDYCFPSRLEEIAILEAAMRFNPKDARAPYYLGNLLYDRRRHKEAMALWQRSAKLDRHFSIVWRNLGIGFFNVSGSARKARAAYENALRANPSDARLLYERDQLWKRMGEKPARRLAELEKHLKLVAQRDDLSVEICALYNRTGRHEKAARILGERNFQPWEGGEGGPLGQHGHAQLGLGRAAMVSGDFLQALGHFQSALTSPFNLGEAKHLLANQSDVHFRIGEAFEALGRKTSARAHWLEAASFKGDFQEMRVRDFSEMSYYSGLALKKLGRGNQARQLFQKLLEHGRSLEGAVAKIDYFATSLPTMLLFEDDLQRRQEIRGLFLQAQALLGLGKPASAAALLKRVLHLDPNHSAAADLYTTTAAAMASTAAAGPGGNGAAQRSQ